MVQSSLSLILSVLVYGVSSWGAQWEIPVQGIQEIQVRAKAAKIQVQRIESGSIRVHVSGARDSAWQQEVQNNVLKIIGPEEGISVDDTTVVLEIPGSVPHTTLVFEEVRAELQSVSRLTLNALKGKIIGRSTGEGVKYFMQKGEIQSFQHAGALEIENFGGKIAVNDGQSSLRIRLFSGELFIEKNLGPITLESQSSSAKINGQQGIVSLQWGKGNLVMNEFSGRLEGVSNDGQLQLQIKSESMVDLQAERGRVNVSLPSDSGANLNVRSATGDVIVPGPLKASREGRFRVARGKLAGSSKGSVSIRAEDASISVR